jgi:hypothetical protein
MKYLHRKVKINMKYLYVAIQEMVVSSSSTLHPSVVWEFVDE